MTLMLKPSSPFLPLKPSATLPPALLRVSALKRSNSAPRRRKLPPKNLRYPRRAKVPPDPARNRFPLPKRDTAPAGEPPDSREEDGSSEDDIGGDSVWTEEEISVISPLFERGPPPKPTKLHRQRPFPLPIPHRSQSLGFPTPKLHVRAAMPPTLSPRSSFSSRVSKNPEVLVGIAKEISALRSEDDASNVLDKWGPFLRKGSLSMTIRELGHMGLPERALQTLCWAQNHRPELFPDDRVLASAVEVLARHKELKIEGTIDKYLNSASRAVVEAMAKGFIRAGNLRMARKVLLFAKDNGRTLDASVHAKLILEAARNPDGYRLAEVLLDELGERENLHLEPQDCTAIMKVCIKLERFEAVENLFNWFKESGRNPGMVMYTTVIHSRYCSNRYREGLVAVWEMEEQGMVLDLPAYRVVIRLCVALNDLARATRYFSRLKEAGFAPTYDIYKDIIKAYAASRRVAKCKQVCKELEMAGMKVDNGLTSLLAQLE